VKWSVIILLSIIVTELEGDENGPDPAVLVADTVNVYEVPLVRPINDIDVADEV
jgi:hypothetical protein